MKINMWRTIRPKQGRGWLRRGTVYGASSVINGAVLKEPQVPKEHSSSQILCTTYLEAQASNEMEMSILYHNILHIYLVIPDAF